MNDILIDDEIRFIMYKYSQPVLQFLLMNILMIDTQPQKSLHE
ncbi:hypothetical protein BSUW23_15640 [Bacillus spizizenii str. W23]|uniref:Uncharacterized protein n=1 Tax=Bacillus spizizenii (strain ATCC 23059 / NRRL B-14472 / W23) TaxID=655816 RepID=E0U008_BACSH|nr:hypothetical protein BSUW23_15640 [Bacillus spizizenii str. W23]